MHLPRTLRKASVGIAALALLSGCAPAPAPIAVPRQQTNVSTNVQDSASPSQTPTVVAVEEKAPAEAEAPVDGQPTTPAEPTNRTEPVESVSPTPSTPPALFGPGSQGEEVREIQHRLLQLQWYEGEITPNYGERTQAAVEGFQSKRGLPVTGEIDEVTLDKLRAMTRRPTHDEMYNVLKPGPALMKAGEKSDKVRDLQARMRQIGWYGIRIDGIYGEKTVEGIRGFQEKRGLPVTGEVDQRTLDKLHAMTRQPTTDELNNIFPSTDTAKARAMRLDERCMTGRAVCISKSQRQLAWVVDGKVQMQMAVRFGSVRTPTREGTFQVEWKSRDHVSKLYGSAMPYALFFSGGQAVHYSSDFARRGYRGASHGCVNVRDKDKVSALFDAARVGDKVIVYSG